MKIVKNICVFSAFLTIILIGLGGFVRATGAGLSCPDWPLCFGKLLPPKMGDGVAQEWIHRIAGATVGFLSLILVSLSWKTRKQNKRFWRMSLLLFVLVGFQGFLGGLTVLMHLNPYIVSSHLAFGTIFFQLLALIAVFVQSDSVKQSSNVSFLYLNLVRLFLFLTFAQMILGGFVGASGASLACPDFPYCFGKVLPDNHTGAHIVHMLHRGLGFLLLLLALTVSLMSWSSLTNRKLKMHITGVSSLFLVQVVLGITNVVFVLPIASAVSHLVLAQIIMLGLLVFYCRLRPQGALMRSVNISPQTTQE